MNLIIRKSLIISIMLGMTLGTAEFSEVQATTVMKRGEEAVRSLQKRFKAKNAAAKNADASTRGVSPTGVAERLPAGGVQNKLLEQAKDAGSTKAAHAKTGVVTRAASPGPSPLAKRVLVTTEVGASPSIIQRLRPAGSSEKFVGDEAAAAFRATRKAKAQRTRSGLSRGVETSN